LYTLKLTLLSTVALALTDGLALWEAAGLLALALAAGADGVADGAETVGRPSEPVSVADGLRNST
jgi:hypothetical protein